MLESEILKNVSLIYYDTPAAFALRSPYLEGNNH
jgi:hypothetical protein